MKKNKKAIKLLILFLLCSLTYIIYITNNKRTIKYVSLGDEYSLSLNSYNNTDYGYNEYIKNYFENLKKLKTYNTYSYKNILIHDLYNDIKSNNQKKPIKRLLRDANFLTISIGLNDVIYLNQKKETNNKINKIVEFDLIRLLKEIQKYYHGTIYLIGYYDTNNQTMAINRILKSIKGKKIKYIYPGKCSIKYCNNPLNNYPNVEGYRKIYKKILEKYN